MAARIERNLRRSDGVVRPLKLFSNADRDASPEAISCFTAFSRVAASGLVKLCIHTDKRAGAGTAALGGAGIIIRNLTFGRLP